MVLSELLSHARIRVSFTSWSTALTAYTLLPLALQNAFISKVTWDACLPLLPSVGLLHTFAACVDVFVTFCLPSEIPQPPKLCFHCTYLGLLFVSRTLNTCVVSCTLDCSMIDNSLTTLNITMLHSLPSAHPNNMAMTNFFYHLYSFSTMDLGSAPRATFSDWFLLFTNMHLMFTHVFNSTQISFYCWMTFHFMGVPLSA